MALCKTVIDLKLPPRSICVNMEVVDNHIIALFDIPERGVVTFLIDPVKLQVTEVVPAPNCFALSEKLKAK
jgi:hypothetical protein